MKKLLVLLLIMNIGLLTACGGNAENTGNTEGESGSLSGSVSSSDSGDADDAGESEDSGESGETETFGFSDLAKAPFLFASGAGGWGTYLTINPDGTFAGEYHDSEMGLTGVDYEGTVYQCSFTGRFSDFTEESEGIYTMKVAELSTEKTPDTEEILEGVKYIYTTPYGIYGDSEVRIFMPDLDISSFSEDFRMWVKGSYYFEGDILPVTAIETTDSVDTYVFTQQN